jgi:3-oxoadipate CoA-transferase alpha subunit
MINKFCDSAAAVMDGVGDGASIFISGFGEAGVPNTLIDLLIETGRRDLTIISNNAGSTMTGVGGLLSTGAVSKIICSYPRSRGSVVFDTLYRENRIGLELVPQGTLVERIRAGGAGIGAFFTPTAAGTRLAENKESRQINGRLHVLEYALTADVALIQADRADRWGNLTYRKAMRNFGPAMAAAARLTIAEVGESVLLGALDPEMVVTPGIFVDRVYLRKNQA